MARTSVESAQAVISTLLSEQERDRENLQRMLAHSEKMMEYLQMMRDEEEQRIEAEASERKLATRKMFGQLLAVEEERKERIALHLADLDGKQTMPSDDEEEAKPANGTTQPQRLTVSNPS